MSKLDKLKPCPFCGSEVELKPCINQIIGSGTKVMYYDISCEKCPCEMEFIESEKEAINYWNTRNGGI